MKITHLLHNNDERSNWYTSSKIKLRQKVQQERMRYYRSSHAIVTAIQGVETYSLSLNHSLPEKPAMKPGFFRETWMLAVLVSASIACDTELSCDFVWIICDSTDSQSLESSHVSSTDLRCPSHAYSSITGYTRV